MASATTRLPLMIHIGDTASPLPAIPGLLRPGDIVTHMYAPTPHTRMDSRGRILPGAVADVSVLELVGGGHDFVDNHGRSPKGAQRLVSRELYSYKRQRCLITATSPAREYCVITVVARHRERNSLLGSIQSPLRNQLLATLAPRECEQLYPHLQLVAMPSGKVLYEHGDVMGHVYYPTSCVVSLLYVLENGGSTELAAVGNEGIVGVPLCMGDDTASSRAVVQTAGHAYRLSAQRFKEGFNSNLGVRASLLRYALALITQTAQMAVCNRHHSVEQQLCRWLLLSMDRLERNIVLATQQNIANMLGVRREGVTEAALKLQRQDAIRYARGKITITNRDRLESLSCECYSVVRRHTERLRARASSPEPRIIRVPAPRRAHDTPLFA